MSLVKKRLTITLIWSIFVVSLLVAPALNDVNAQSLWSQQEGTAGMQTAYNVGTNSTTDVRTYVVNVIKVFLTFLGLIFLIVIILAGYRWMTAGGNEDNVKTAKNQLKNGIIGFIIIIISYALVDFVAKVVTDEFFDVS